MQNPPPHTHTHTHPTTTHQPRRRPCLASGRRLFGAGLGLGSTLLPCHSPSVRGARLWPRRGVQTDANPSTTKRRGVAFPLTDSFSRFFFTVPLGAQVVLWVDTPRHEEAPFQPSHIDHYINQASQERRQGRAGAVRGGRQPGQGPGARLLSHRRPRRATAQGPLAGPQQGSCVDRATQLLSSCRQAAPPLFMDLASGVDPQPRAAGAVGQRHAGGGGRPGRVPHHLAPHDGAAGVCWAWEGGN